MWHGAGADLAFLEALRDGLIARHEADGGGQAGRAGAELHQRGDRVEVQRTRVDLAHRIEDALETEVLRNRALQLV